LSKR
jgi:hypothetical protein